MKVATILDIEREVDNSKFILLYDFLQEKRVEEWIYDNVDLPSALQPKKSSPSTPPSKETNEDG